MTSLGRSPRASPAGPGSMTGSMIAAEAIAVLFSSDKADGCEEQVGKLYADDAVVEDPLSSVGPQGKLPGPGGKLPRPRPSPEVRMLGS
jgi:hypothetical protein